MNDKKDIKVSEIAAKIRSKNAGPFWVTVDVFCHADSRWQQLRSALSVAVVSELFQLPADVLKRYEIESLHVLKFSFPRPVVQGSRFDRDMHGAQYGVLLAQLAVPVDT